MAEVREIADGVHVVDAPQRFFGIEVGTRMTLLELGGGLLVHSPIAFEPEHVAHLGTPRWVLAPNLFHHLYVGTWECETWGVRGLPKKRPDVDFAGVIDSGVIDSDESPFGTDLWVYGIRSFKPTNEVVVLHRPSRTLVVSDLCFNLESDAPWLTRVVMWLALGYPGPRTTVLERWFMKRERAREDLRTIPDQDFDRLIMAHGHVIETGGKDALRRAFNWLL